MKNPVMSCVSLSLSQAANEYWILPFAGLFTLILSGGEGQGWQERKEKEVNL